MHVSVNYFYVLDSSRPATVPQDRVPIVEELNGYLGRYKQREGEPLPRSIA